MRKKISSELRILLEDRSLFVVIKEIGSKDITIPSLRSFDMIPMKLRRLVTHVELLPHVRDMLYLDEVYKDLIKAHYIHQHLNISGSEAALFNLEQQQEMLDLMLRDALFNLFGNQKHAQMWVLGSTECAFIDSPRIENISDSSKDAFEELKEHVSLQGYIH